MGDSTGTREGNTIQRLFTWQVGVPVLFGVACFVLHASSAFHESLWPDEARHMYRAGLALREPGSLIDVSWRVHPPFLFVGIGLLSLLMPMEWAGRMLGPAFSGLGVLLIFALGKRLGGVWTGVLAALFFAVNPLVIFLSTRVLFDLPQTVMCVLTVLCLLSFEAERSRRRGILLGVVLGLTLMTKNKGVVVLGIPGFYYAAEALLAWRRSRAELRAFWKGLEVPLLTFLPFIFVWLVLNFSLGGSWLPPSLRSVSRAAERTLGMERVPPGITALVEAVPWPLLLGAAIGAAVAVKKLGREGRVVVAWLAAMLLAALASSHPDPRHIAELIPVAGLLAALAIAEGFRWTRENGLGYAPWVSFAGLLVWAYSEADAALEQRALRARFSYVGYQEGAAWLREHAADARVQIQAKENMRYLLGRDLDPEGVSTFPPTKAEFEATVATLHEPHYVVLDHFERDVPKWLLPLDQKKVAEFLQMGYSMAHVVRRATDPRHPDRKVIVLVILQRPADVAERPERPRRRTRGALPSSGP